MPRLLRFYGGDIERWYWQVPSGMVRACARALPRLQAEESLLMAERLAVGTGGLKKEAATRVRRAWVEAATGGRGVRRPRATPAALLAMGIGYRAPDA